MAHLIIKHTSYLYPYSLYLFPSIRKDAGLGITQTVINEKKAIKNISIWKGQSSEIKKLQTNFGGHEFEYDRLDW